ncbi:MAG: cupin domain-containing protein [Bacteroidota bacterium]
MAQLYRTQDTEEYYFEERCYVRELLNAADAPDLSIAQARVTPGTTTVWHALQSTELYYILSGRGRAEVADQQWEVGPGDLVRIAPTERQRITNIGTEDLVFLAICQPRFQVEDYTDLEA